MQRRTIDCLFLHPPQEVRGKGIFIMDMAMGILALADFLHSHGFHTRILHLGVEAIANPRFTISRYLKGKHIPFVAISLHWYQQSRACIQLVRTLKKASPATHIILGGFTASYFADDILKAYPLVDFIIRGEGEIPLLRLLQESTRQAPDYFSVPQFVLARSRCDYS